MRYLSLLAISSLFASQAQSGWPKGCYASGQPWYAEDQAQAFLPTVCDYLVKLGGTPNFKNKDTRTARRTFIETNVHDDGQRIHDDNDMRVYQFKVELVKGQGQALRKDDCVAVMGQIFTAFTLTTEHDIVSGWGEHNESGSFRYSVDPDMMQKEKSDTWCNMTWNKDGSMVVKPLLPLSL
ncbi:uncharacterized protein BDZ99DRAFT_481428 [Mytilinidion resinicola]|uniref:Ecp2 effector protein domain-containing protein n=1 Tax=Mytilinidion resinicola TaxID=574789 RepID=A0A6A6Y6X5_9PEZI|nr:uncharacterized protein BDZ99DRAFT_481428 [Mytilinidion resinicola]KAF2804278.1 hypothetical protein BDZ99DRAFT_481428 [Mytilinidion resinicola]